MAKRVRVESLYAGALSELAHEFQTRRPCIRFTILLLATATTAREI